jgi:hypothetical protein
VETEGNDMDVLRRLLLGSHRGSAAERGMLRLDRTAGRSRIPVTSNLVEAWKMVLYLLWIVTLTAPVIALTLTAGCTPLPRKASETRFVAAAHDTTANDATANNATANNAAAAAVPTDAAGDFWKREQSREIKFGRGGIVSIIERAGPTDEELTWGRRVAITEFSVEFVDVQFQNPFGHPTMINVSSAKALPAEPATDSGSARTNQTPMSTADQMSPADQIQISQTLRDVFERYLRTNGLIILPQSDVTASAGYANLKPRPSVNSPWAQFLKPMTTDTGIVLRTHTVAAPGLGVATCGSAALASAEREIKSETDADIVMAVKLRVGTAFRKAALEQFSSIRWTAADQSITLTAQKTLVSESNVTDDSRIIPFGRPIEPVHQEQFIHQLEAMLPAFIKLAFPSLPRKTGPGDPFATVANPAKP